jgi:hypothetical protein
MSMFSMESDYSELLRRPNWLILPSPEAQPAPRVHSSINNCIGIVSLTQITIKNKSSFGQPSRTTTSLLIIGNQ